MREIGKVCGWCGRPLGWCGEPPEHAETCGQAYGVICGPALEQASKMIQEQAVIDMQETEERK